MSLAQVILVVDDDPVSRGVVCEALTEAGMVWVECSSGEEARAFLEVNVPQAVLLDLLMPAPDGFALLTRIRETPRLSRVPVVVLTALDADEEIERVFAAGADDYVQKPFRPVELMVRLRGQIRLGEFRARLSARERDQQTALELTQRLASTLDLRDILFTVVQRIAEVAHVDRCSIVLFAEADGIGYVLATSDDPQLRDLPIELRKYPEIVEVARTGKPLVIGDAARHPLFDALRQGEGGLGFKSLSLVPILHEHGPMGVLFLRSRNGAPLEEHELSLVSTVANATAIALQNARILQSLRAETEKITNLRVEAERRVLLFQRYADFFESAADGIVVMDRNGRVLFTNPRARAITGFGEQELLGVRWLELASAGGRDRLATVMRGFADATYPRDVDFDVARKSGESVTLSISFSSVLHEDDAVLCTFRDVTLERRTAVELEQTKEFLERVIDSSVDGIVSANLQGTVVLFNRAAARLFGYSPREVVGKMRVERLYPPGVAREIMRKIRDPESGGYGKLEGHRVDMLGADGSEIAVSLSAALVMDSGRPVGSVGIFTDIRERLAMQSRLDRAQEELRARERMAIVAELAGATAHELNQPLTSVIGYAELLRRKVADDSQLTTAANVIVRESERMAEIVRKIGKITKYETKSYVGGAKILDLERASGAEPEVKDS